MTAKHVRHRPVFEDSRFLGVISSARGQAIISKTSLIDQLHELIPASSVASRGGSQAHATISRRRRNQSMRLVNRLRFRRRSRPPTSRLDPRIGLLRQGNFRFDDQVASSWRRRNRSLCSRRTKRHRWRSPADLQRALFVVEVIVWGMLMPRAGAGVRADCGPDVARCTASYSVGRPILGANHKTLLPTPFTRMPLTYGALWRDGAHHWTKSRLRLVRHLQQARLGSTRRMARELGGLLKAPRGYPALPAGYAPPPNLEDPCPIVVGDVPLPLCWATFHRLPCGLSSGTRNPKPPPYRTGRIRRELP